MHSAGAEAGRPVYGGGDDVGPVHQPRTAIRPGVWAVVTCWHACRALHCCVGMAQQECHPAANLYIQAAKLDISTITSPCSQQYQHAVWLCRSTRRSTCCMRVISMAYTWSCCRAYTQMLYMFISYAGGSHCDQWHVCCTQCRRGIARGFDLRRRPCAGGHCKVDRTVAQKPAHLRWCEHWLLHKARGSITCHRPSRAASPHCSGL